jgi:ParG
MTKSSPQPTEQLGANKAEIGVTKEVELSRINAQITSEEHLKLKLYCVKNRTSITELVRKMIAALPE